MTRAIGAPVFLSSRTKFPSGGGVVRSAGVVLRIRNVEQM